MYAGAVLSLIWTLLVLPQRDVLRDALDEQNLDVTAGELDSLINTMIGVIVVVGLITTGLWVLMARTNRDGKSWARVLATILGAIAILVGLLGMLQVDLIGLVMNLALVVLAVWILVLLYRRESTEYYNAMSQQPRY
jgi:heme A synthase